MKMLIVGGAHQGKLAYSMEELALSKTEIAGGAVEPIEAVLAAKGINHLHLLVRRLMAEGQSPAEVILAALEARESWLILCDEIGAGVVPIDKTDRRWREEVGRLCAELARRADRVERIVCGLPQRLKG